MTIAGRASGSAKREAPLWGRRGSKPAHPPRGHPRTQGPSSRDSSSARSAGWVGGGCPMAATGPPGIHCERPPPCRTSLPAQWVADASTFPLGHDTVGARRSPKAARAPATVAPVGPLIRLRTGGGSGNSRAASMVSDDRAMLQPLSSSIAGPVRPGRSHPKTHNHRPRRPLPLARAADSEPF